MLKKILAAILASMCFLPMMAKAQSTVPQGGTGTTSIPAGYLLVGSTTIRTTNTRDFTGTSTVAGNLDVLGNLKAGSVITPMIVPTTGSLACSTTLAIDTPTFLVDCANNRVGIGTTTPSQKLEVAGSVQVDGTLRLKSATGAGNLTISDDGGGTGTISNSGNSFLIISSNVSTNFSAGNVGIGSSTPEEKLTVAGVVKATGRYVTTTTGEVFSATTGGTGPQAMRLRNTGNDVYFGTEGSTAGGFFTGSLSYATVIYGNTAIQDIISGVPRTTLLTNGNLGIGTTTPAQKLAVAGGRALIFNSTTSNYPSVVSDLTVVGESNPVITVSQDAGSVGSAGIQFFTAGTGSFQGRIYAGVAAGTHGQGLVFERGGTSIGGGTFMAKFDGNGNFGVGTTTPSVRLTAYDASNSYSGMFYGGNSLSNTNGVALGTRSNVPAIQGYSSTFSSTQNLALQPQAGSVGIGTTSPATKLDVYGNASVTLNAATDQVLKVQNQSATGLSGFVAQDDTGSRYLTFGVQNSTGLSGTYGNPGEGVFRSSTSATGLVLSITSGPLRVMNGIAGTERLRMDSDGNLGIGTTSPQRRLEVYAGSSGGGSNSGANLVIEDSTTNYLQFLNPSANTAGILFGDQTDSAAGGAFYNHATDAFDVRTNGTASADLTINSSGNVGIGTSTPVASLDVYSSSNTRVNVADPSGILSAVTASGVNYIQSGSAMVSGSTANLNIGPYGSTLPWIRIIGSTGNVGIGTSSANARLHVANTSGNAVVNIDRSGTSQAAEVRLSTNGSATPDWYVSNRDSGALVSGQTKRLDILDGSGSAYVSIPNGGNVGIGTTTPRAKLHVNGVVMAPWSGNNALPSFVVGDDLSYGMTRINGNSNIGIIAAGSIAAQFAADGTTAAGYGIQNSTNARTGGLAMTTGAVAWGSSVTQDVGISRIATGTIAVGTGANQSTAGTIVAASVGVGTTSPSQALSVQGNALVSGDISAANMNATGTLSLSALATPAGSFLAVNASGAVIATTTPSGGGGGGSLSGTTGQTAYFSGTNTAVGTSSIFISTAQNVGIGNTSPTYALHLGSQTPTGLLGAAGMAIGVSANAATGLEIQNNSFGASGATALTLSSVGGSNNFSIYAYGPGAAGSLYGIDSYAMSLLQSGVNLVLNASSDVVMAAGGTRAMNIKATSGNVGIGTTSPFAKLSIAGAAYVGGNLTATGTVAIPALATAAGTFLAVDPSGNVIATSTPSGGGGSTPTVTTVVPRPVAYTNAGSQANDASSNTVMRLGMVSVPTGITVSSISFNLYNVAVAGSFKIGLYTENGQTLVLSTTTPSYSTSGFKTVTLSSPVAVAAGNYYVAILSQGSANIGALGYTTATENGMNNVNSSVSGEPVLEGTLTVTANTLPATFTPSSITSVSNATFVFRMDN